VPISIVAVADDTTTATNNSAIVGVEKLIARNEEAADDVIEVDDNIDFESSVAEEVNEEVHELQKQLHKYKRVVRKLYAEVKVLRRIPKSPAVFNVLENEDLWKVHTCDSLKELPRYRGKTKSGSMIQSSLQCRVCKMKCSTYCIQCTFICGMFPEIFACHETEKCMTNHHTHINKQLRDL